MSDGRRVGNKVTALAAWVKRGHGAAPGYPIGRLASWAASKEWKDRGCIPSPAKFLGDDKYTPPPSAAWKPSPIIDKLSLDDWAAAMLDVTAELRNQQLLTPPRQALLDQAMNDRRVIRAARWWHDLVVGSPTVRKALLHDGSRTGQERGSDGV